VSRKVTWSREALDDLGDAFEYIAADSPDYALRLIDRIEEAGNKLGQHATGRPGRMAGTYEKSLPQLGYIIAYGLDKPAGSVTILRVIHAARNWSAGSWPD
jgi:plasmid stabilization system protein ParE